MSIVEIALLGISLAMDAFAVSITTGITLKDLRLKHAVKVGLFFGGFQFLMPVLGYIAGSTVSSYIESFDHWIAFGLLAFIGGKMLWECLMPPKGGAEAEVVDPTATSKLFVLAIATSIDALAVGISLAILKENIWLCSSWIGVITFILSVIGVMLGKKMGEKLRKSAEIVGGIVLIGIGVKILLEHIL